MRPVCTGSGIPVELGTLESAQCPFCHRTDLKPRVALARRGRGRARGLAFPTHQPERKGA